MVFSAGFLEKHLSCHSMKFCEQKYIWISIFLIISLFFSCTLDKKEISDLQDFIPTETDYLLQSPDLSNFLNNLDSTSFFKNNPSLFKNSNILHLQNLNNLSGLKESLVVFVQNEEGIGNYLLITRDSLQIDTDSIQNRSRETLKYEEFETQKISTENFTTYFTAKSDVFLVSNSQGLLESVMKKDFKTISSEGYNMARTVADKNRTSLFINNKSIDTLFKNIFPASSLPLNNLGAWSVLDLEIEDQNFLINGILSLEDDSPELMDVFQDVPAQKNRIAEITPTNASGFYSFTYSDFGMLFKNLNNFRKDSLEISPNHILNFTKEAGIIYSEENLLAFTTTDPELAKESLIAAEKLSDFRGIEIFQNPDPEHFSEFLRPLVKEDGLKLYAFLEDFLIYSNSTESIENIITNFQNNTTLYKQQYYQEAVANLAGSSSLLFVANNANIKRALRENSSEEYKNKIEALDLKGYPITAIQFVQDQNFAHLHGILKMSQGNTSEGIRQLASIKLDSELGILPHLVQNNKTKELEILVQDEENVLYLFNSNAELQWKKEFSTRITGDIVQVDLYRNGNFQYLFNTPNALHVLDRNGKPVKPFPLEFKDEITRPVTVFDYDNNGNYRFVVTQKNNLLMYDSKGKILHGFDFDRTDSPILQSPKHIRLKNKDYIVFPEENGKLNIISRQGNSRISVKERIEPSENEWYEHKGNFVSANSAGQLVFVDEDGNVEKRGNASEANLKISATENILASISENILKINGKEITLDYGLYTAPKIFQPKGKNYITVTDTQAQRLLVFDENANLLPGFPVYANSAADMAVDKNNNILITVKGEENSVLIYRM